LGNFSSQPAEGFNWWLAFYYNVRSGANQEEKSQKIKDFGKNFFWNFSIFPLLTFCKVHYNKREEQTIVAHKQKGEKQC
jgi:hypothetical protein